MTGFSTPNVGDRYVSVQFQILDKGTGTYQDDPQGDVAVKDAAGQTFEPDFVTSTSAGPQLPSAVTLASGDKALGFVTFDVPIGDKITTVQYSLGFDSDTGEWTVG
jgi:hypothetical protein